MPHTLTELVAGISPTVIEETRPFWEGTLREELLVQICNACGNRQLPGGPCCTTCLSQDLRWEPSSGRGSVFSFTVVRHPFHPSFAEQLPYVVADVQLEEGPILTTNVTDVSDDEVSIGLPIEVWFDEEMEDAFHAKLKLPKFRPRREGR
jgi:uncharacterized OB-fold protein